MQFWIFLEMSVEIVWVLLLHELCINVFVARYQSSFVFLKMFVEIVLVLLLLWICVYVFVVKVVLCNTVCYWVHIYHYQSSFVVFGNIHWYSSDSVATSYMYLGFCCRRGIMWYSVVLGTYVPLPESFIVSGNICWIFSDSVATLYMYLCFCCRSGTGWHWVVLGGTG